MPTWRPRPTETSASSSLLRLGPALLLLGAVVVGCEGDTLYDATGPDVGQPGTGGEASMVVTVELDAPDRIELTDAVTVRASAWDDSGAAAVDTLGYTLVVRGPEGGTVTVRSEARAVPAVPGDTAYASFTFRPEWLTAEALPSAFALEVHGFATTANRSCTAATAGSDETFACRSQASDDGILRLASTDASPIPLQVVPGRTVPFPSNPFLVGDVQADPTRGVLYVSNRASSRLHTFDPATFEWGEAVSVGSEPWGLHLNRTGDTLLVANSGGTSISYVSLEGTPREVVSRRLQTRNTPLFEIELGAAEDTTEVESIVPDSLARRVHFLSFSDRPQHLAQDAEGRILYATRPTGANALGTVRVIGNEPGWSEPETRVLARLPEDTDHAEGWVSVLNADSIVPYENGFIEVFAHEPGFPGRVVRSGVHPPLVALSEIRARGALHVDFRKDRRWDLHAVSFADTTYVAASGDRGWIAFGDGGEEGAGRIVLWHAGTAALSRRLPVADLVHNASERVRSLELNQDGSLGAARGAFGTYFFSNDLRLRGTVPEHVNGGGGVALHPGHPDTPAPPESTDRTVAFTMTGDRTLRILDTVHYRERGSVSLRDPIVGPLRVAPPRPSDNGGQGGGCSGPSCVVAKVFAVTEGGVVTLDVRASDVAPLP